MADRIISIGNELRWGDETSRLNNNTTSVIPVYFETADGGGKGYERENRFTRIRNVCDVGQVEY